LDPKYKVTICGSYRLVIKITKTLVFEYMYEIYIIFFFYKKFIYSFFFLNFRRGKEFSGDIDTLISHPSFMSHGLKKKTDKLQVVVDILKKNNLITETISLGEAKFMVII